MRLYYKDTYAHICFRNRNTLAHTHTYTHVCCSRRHTHAYTHKRGTYTHATHTHMQNYTHTHILTPSNPARTETVVLASRDREVTETLLAPLRLRTYSAMPPALNCEKRKKERCTTTKINQGGV